jgi:type II secretory pathway pseudopilin PulG
MSKLYQLKQLPSQTRQKQHGVILLGMMAILVIIITTLSLQYLNSANLKQLKIQKTQQVLAEAKEALIAFSTEEITGLPSESPLTCNQNCPRPGDLPCPDLNNDGEAEINCNLQNQRLGRLPWKTLGINDLRDGSGETLWYVVSERYKNNTRVLPLNSETFGTISLRNTQGNLFYDAKNGSGLVALIIAPNDVLTRSDNFQQSRATQSDVINAKNYLDIAFGEDNIDFIDNSDNGFISGNIKQDNKLILNDIILPVTTAQMHAVMEARVLSEVRSALSINAIFPTPALMADTSCLGFESVNNDACMPDQNATLGRIPVGESFIINVGGTPETQYRSLWESANANSILKGQKDHNWFHQNGWRELILYARVKVGESLTLQNATTPLALPSNDGKQVILLSAGRAIKTQTRDNNNEKSNLVNYLEDENISPLDNQFSRYRINNDKNDNAASIP